MALEEGLGFAAADLSASSLELGLRELFKRMGVFEDKEKRDCWNGPDAAKIVDTAIHWLAVARDRGRARTLSDID